MSARQRYTYARRFFKQAFGSADGLTVEQIGINAADDGSVVTLPRQWGAVHLVVADDFAYGAYHIEAETPHLRAPNYAAVDCDGIVSLEGDPVRIARQLMASLVQNLEAMLARYPDPPPAPKRRYRR